MSDNLLPQKKELLDQKFAISGADLTIFREDILEKKIYILDHKPKLYINLDAKPKIQILNGL